MLAQIFTGNDLPCTVRRALCNPGCAANPCLPAKNGVRNSYPESSQIGVKLLSSQHCTFLDILVLDRGSDCVNEHNMVEADTGLLSVSSRWTCTSSIHFRTSAYPDDIYGSPSRPDSRLHGYRVCFDAACGFIKSFLSWGKNTLWLGAMSGWAFLVWIETLSIFLHSRLFGAMGLEIMENRCGLAKQHTILDQRTPFSVST